jgi:Lrp/AsnC family transcriptional regulator of ectoine degradation
MKSARGFSQGNHPKILYSDPHEGVPMKLDAIDLKILKAVQADGRITKLALAQAVGLSPTPCWLRLRRLETSGIVAGYHARISLVRIVSVLDVMVQVTLANHRQSDFERFEQIICKMPEVTSCWAVGGGIDYILKITTKDVSEYQRLIDDMLNRDLGIERYFTYVVTKIVKDRQEGFGALEILS